MEAGIEAFSDPGLPPGENRQARWRAALFTGVKIVAFTLVLAFAVESLADRWRQIEWEEVNLHYPLLVASLVSLVAARTSHGLALYHLLGAFGHALPRWPVVLTSWVFSLGRYVPGKIGTVVGSIYLFRRMGVAASIVLATLFMSTVIALLAGAAFAAPLLFGPVVGKWSPHGWIAGLGVIGCGLAFLHPRLLTSLSNWVLRRLGRAPLPMRMEIDAIVKAVVWTVMNVFLLGVALWLAWRAMVPVGIAEAFTALGVIGLATVAALLAFFAPGGIGVQEGVYLVVLGPSLGASISLLVVNFRLLNIIADLGTGLFALGVLRRTSITEPVDPIHSSPIPTDHLP